MLGAEAWGPGSHRSGLVNQLYVCVRENLSPRHRASAGRVCNVMQAPFAPVTSFSTLLLRPDGD